jgi:hypothetical protein
MILKKAILYGARGDGTVVNLSNTFDPLGTDIALASTDVADIFRPLSQAPPGIYALWLESPLLTGPTTPIMEVQAVDFKRGP